MQPTIGLEGVQSEFINILGKDGEIVQNTIDDINYIENLRDTYKKLKKHCENFSFCIDISDIAPLLHTMFTAMQDIIIKKEMKLLHQKFLRNWIFKINENS